jgi:predicted sugar kinase
MPETMTALETALENEAVLLLKMISELQNEDLYEFIRRIAELKVRSGGTNSTNEILHIARNVTNIENALENFYRI